MQTKDFLIKISVCENENWYDYHTTFILQNKNNSFCLYIVHIMLSSQEIYMIRLTQTRALKLTYYQSSPVLTGCIDGVIFIVLSYINIQFIILD